MECLHCGLPAPAPLEYCCPGCAAVAGAIKGLGLEAYYRLRTAPAAAPVALAPVPAGFDDPLLRERCVRPAGEGALECELLVEGLRCAACAWLVEHALQRAPGVASATVNYAARRARVEWREGATSLFALLAAIRAVGYGAAPYEQERLALVEANERRTLLRRLWVAGLGMMQVMMYAYPAYVAAEGEITPDVAALMGWAGLLLTAPVVAYSAAPFFAGAWRDLRARALGMDVPIALGIAAAFAASVAALLRGGGAVYFDSVAMFVFFLLGARYLELQARARAGVALQHLARLEPRNAERLLEAEGHATETVAAARLRPGDRVLVKSGESVPADGELEGPEALVGEAWLSGESRPLERRRGDAVLGGSINAGRAFVLRVRRVGAETAIAAIQRLMERALDERPAWTAAAQRASQAFVLAILVAAGIAAAAWGAVDPARAVEAAVAVLVITCPCALALAAPAALTAGSGALARRGFVVTRAGTIERLAGVTDVVFDKTGTLTEGRPRLLAVEVSGRATEARCRALAASLARVSSHPLDRALALAAEGPVPAALDARSEPGAGIEGRIDGRRVRLGNARFVAALSGPLPDHRGEDTVAWLGDERGWLALFRMGDSLRADARAAVAALERAGLRTHVLSGDGAEVTRRIADEAGIARAEGGARPESKLERVRALQAAGARVAMVGDGINDAPVLAQADVSIAMGAGADLAQARADAVLLSNSLAGLAAALAIARRTRRVVRQNLAWALAYNAIAIPLAFAGLVTPLVAGIAMATSSLLVVANALRLLR